MDLIPFSLILSNSSTLLAWLCVYVPHSLLLFLLALGSLVSVLAVVAAVALFMKLIALIYLAVDYSFKRPGPRNSSPRSPARRIPSRLILPTSGLLPLPSPLRCPLCRFELAPYARPHWSAPRFPQLPPNDIDYVPTRRASDITPVAHDPIEASNFPSDDEPAITTPPRAKVFPAKGLLRRSPRIPKPRKFSF